MKKEENCENCKKSFTYYVCKGTKKRRFCNKKCWYEFNQHNLKKFNSNRFQWKNCSEKEKLERIKKRFEENVIKNEGCWGWKGYFDKNGYTLLGSGSNGKGFKERRGHRISWLLYRGELEPNMLVCHTCDTPSCTNPDHLFLGTPKDNVYDCIQKCRSSIGSKQPRSKLKEKDVFQILYLLKQGVKSRRIAEDFDISTSQISAIKNGKSWKHCKLEDKKCSNKN